MLVVENLTKYYGKVRGIEKLNLALEKGEVFGLIGPNGAGKSTTMRSIMNFFSDCKYFFPGNPIDYLLYCET